MVTHENLQAMRPRRSYHAASRKTKHFNMANYNNPFRVLHKKCTFEYVIKVWIN